MDKDRVSAQNELEFTAGYFIIVVSVVISGGLWVLVFFGNALAENICRVVR